jgi:probable rRNA maturation factor
MPSLVSDTRSLGPDVGDGHGAAELEPRSRLDIDVVHVAGDWGDVEPISDCARIAAAAVAATQQLSDCTACLALSSDAEVQALNASYRGKSNPTNVLSFPAGGGAVAEPEAARNLGDLILAAETVRREAEDLGLPLHHHVQHLVVHGLLHLLGFDHEADTDAEAMEALEVDILGRIGVANPYLAAGDLVRPERSQTETTES